MSPLPAGTRILIAADGVSARFGGEAVLPLHYFTHLARRGHDVRLLAHARTREELFSALPDLVERMEFVEDRAIHRLIWRMGAPFPWAIREHLFGNLLGLVTGFEQRRRIRLMVREGRVDLVHQPTPVSPAYPSALWGLGVPVVIGPMNGGMNFPPGYEDYNGRASRVFLRLGRGLAGMANRLIPGKRRAAMLLVANARTRAALPLAHPNVVELVENGVDLSRWPLAAVPAPRRDGFRLMFMGRLIRLKGLDFALRAIAALPSGTGRVTLDILGDGPERAPLEALARELGLSDRVRFHGFRPQAECAAELAAADALILPSLRECGGAVVLEAMALGKPVIAADWGGPADYLDASCGLLVDPVPRDGFAARLGEAIRGLASDPETAARMGLAGSAKVRAAFDWQAKIDRIEALYAQVLRGRSPSS